MDKSLQLYIYLTKLFDEATANDVMIQGDVITLFRKPFGVVEWREDGPFIIFQGEHVDLRTAIQERKRKSAISSIKQGK